MGKRIKIIYCLIVIIASVLQIRLSDCLAMDETYPNRIICLAPFLTEELFLLDQQDKIVGVTSYCLRPKQAQEKEKVGSVTGANVEKIVMLKPDIVLTSPLSDIKVKNKLKRLGIKTVEFSPAKNFSQICRQMEQLGKIAGAEGKAKEIISKAEKEVKQVNKDIADLPKPKVFIQVGAEPLFTMNKDYFIHDLIVLAGGINIAAESRVGIYSREKVIEANPDCIIIADMGIIGEKEKALWQKHEMLNAVKNDKIYIIDSYIVCSPTPVSFVESLKKIAVFLHSRGESE